MPNALVPSSTLYRRSDVLMQVVVAKTTNGKKGKAPVTTEFVIGVIDWAESLLGDGFAYHAADGSHVRIAPIWIGWTRNAGETFITNQDIIEKHGLIKISDVAKEYPCQS